MSQKTKIPLEAILPEILKEQIQQTIRLFIKGVTWHIGGSSNVIYTLGYLELTGAPAVKDDYVFVMICQIIEQYYGVPLEKILADGWTRYYCEKRQMLQVFTVKYTRLSKRDIARRTGKMNHATIYHSEKVILNLISTNQRIAQEYNDIDERIKAKLEPKE